MLKHRFSVKLLFSWGSSERVFFLTALSTELWCCFKMADRHIFGLPRVPTVKCVSHTNHMSCVKSSPESREADADFSCDCCGWGIIFQSLFHCVFCRIFCSDKKGFSFIELLRLSFQFWVWVQLLLCTVLNTWSQRCGWMNVLLVPGAEVIRESLFFLSHCDW